MMEAIETKFHENIAKHGLPDTDQFLRWFLKRTMTEDQIDELLQYVKEHPL